MLAIRPGKLEDVAAIMEIVRPVVSAMNAQGNFQWSNNYPTPEVFSRDVANKALFVGTENDQVVAFVVLDEYQPPEYAPIPWRQADRAIVLHRFAVAPAENGKGIGHQVEAFVCDHTRSLGLSYIRTDTNSANRAMQRFLTNHGYVQTGSLFFAKCTNPFFTYDKILG